jgi:hypothetical protein
VTDFDWDRGHVFPPYMGPDEIEHELGFDWGGAGDSASGQSDAFYLLVFVNGGQVARAFDHEIGDGDLACMAHPFVEGGLTPSEAVLSAEGSGHSLVSLAHPRDAREALRIKRCLRTYS